MRQCNKERELEREEKEEKYREKRAREDRKKERTTSLQKILQDTQHISSKFTYIENWCRKFPSQCSVEQKISPDSAKWFFHRHHRLRVWRSWFYRIHWFGTMRTLLFWCEGPLWTCLSFINSLTLSITYLVTHLLCSSGCLKLNKTGLHRTFYKYISFLCLFMVQFLRL